MVSTQRYAPRFNPANLLESAYATIGEHTAKGMGLVKNGYQNFSYQWVKTLEQCPGNVVVMDVSAHTNFSEAEDGITRNYGGITGTAGINLNGQPTLRNTIPAVVIPDRKRNTMQRNAIRESFASLCKAGKRTMGKMEVNPAAVHLFQEKSSENGMVQSLLVIEAAGIFGELAGGKPFYWSILQYPLENYLEEKQEAPKSARTRTSRTRRTKPADSETPEHGSAEVEAMASV